METLESEVLSVTQWLLQETGSWVALGGMFSPGITFIT